MGEAMQSERVIQPTPVTLRFLKKINMKTSTFDCISQFLAEFLSTAMLVFLGCTGATYSNTIENSPFQLSVNIGLVVSSIVQCFGCVCGAHLNPAITLAVYVYDMISLPMALAYCVAQILGAYLGYGLMVSLVPPKAISLGGSGHNVCFPTLHPEVSLMQGFWIEFIITAMIIWTTCSAADPRNLPYQDSLPIRFGIIIACVGISVGQLTGANTNAAKALAASLWSSNYENLWLYASAPLCSAAVSSIFYKLVLRREYVDTTPQLEKFCCASMWMQLHCYGMDPQIAELGVLSFGLCDGLALMIVMQTFACVSGAYMNPCITIAGVIMGQLKWDMAIIYVVLQYIGHVLGLMLAYYTSPWKGRDNHYCVSNLPEQTTLMGGCLWEFLMTSTWVLAQCSAWDKRTQHIQESVHLRMGLVLAALMTCGGYISDLSMNPAKSLAGALFNGFWDNNWIYSAFPLLAAITMPFVHKYLLNEGDKSADE